MKVLNIYSKRKQRKSARIPDVYVYSKLPTQLRTQIVYLMRDVLGTEQEFHKTKSVSLAYKVIVEGLKREYGVFDLNSFDNYQAHSSSFKELEEFILNQNNPERCLDGIELIFRFADQYCRDYDYRRDNEASKMVDECIKELNYRFQEHGIGYEFIDGEIIRIDSKLIHQEAVKPALALLNREGFEGPRDEFLSAYEHYRHRKYKESLNDSLKAFESMMKTICDRKAWTYKPTDTAKSLIRVCIDKGIFPSYSQNHLNALATLLESSVPTMRNKLGGHGQGAEISNIEPCVVAYTLHMTASVIVLLGELEKNL